MNYRRRRHKAVESIGPAATGMLRAAMTGQVENYEMREYRINRERYIRTGDSRAFARMLDHVTISFQDFTIPELRGNGINVPPVPGSVDYWSRGTPPLAPDSEFIDEGNWWQTP